MNLQSQAAPVLKILVQELLPKFTRPFLPLQEQLSVPKMNLQSQAAPVLKILVLELLLKFTRVPTDLGILGKLGFALVNPQR